MRKDEKVAVLRELLAKVRENAGDRLVGRAGAPSVRRQVPPQLSRFSGVDEALPLEAFDSWSTPESSLGPAAARRGAAGDASFGRPPLPSFPRTLPPPAFSQEIPPPSATPHLPEAMPEPVDAPRELVVARPPASARALPVDDHDDDDAPHESAARGELERAIALVTRERRVDPAEPGAIFSQAAQSLYERRSSPSSEVPLELEPREAAPRALPLPPRVPFAPPSERPRSEPLSVSTPPASVSMPAPLSRMGRRRPFRSAWQRRASGRGTLRSVARIAIAVALLSGAAWLAIALVLRRSHDQELVRVAAVVSAPPAVVAPPGPSPRLPEPVASAALASAAPIGSASGAPARPPIPDASRLTDDKGYLLVESAADRQVYVNGVLVGEPNSWLVVPCGSRYLRLAERTPSSARSFPAWASEGVSIVTPCRGATAAKVP